MRLLFITQIVDRNDGVLGFVHGWLVELAQVFEQVHVICLRKGETTLPENVTVYSLGKEDGVSRVKYLRRFFSNVIGLRREYDGVFVHMNSEYVILAGILWRMWGKKIVLWYNHTFGNWKTKLAMILANTICCTSRFSYTAGTRKTAIMPAGIDTRVFKPDTSVERIPRSVLYLGRIAPIKGVHILVEAVKKLHRRGVSCKLDIYGEALPRDNEYENSLKASADDSITFYGRIPHREAVTAFRSHEIFVNLTPSGNYDKTVLEAMACGGVSLVSSAAFGEILTGEFQFKEGNAEDLARALEKTLARSASDRQILGEKFSRYVVENHDLQLLAKKIRALYGN